MASETRHQAVRSCPTPTAVHEAADGAGNKLVTENLLELVWPRNIP